MIRPHYKRIAAWGAALCLSSATASAGWYDTGSFAVGTLAVARGIACGIGFEKELTETPARWGDHLVCFAPTEGGQRTVRNSPPGQGDSPFEPEDDSLRIKSIAIAWDHESPLREGDGDARDKRVIYALRGDGIVFASYGAVEEPDRDYAFGPWSDFAEPVTELGVTLEFRQIGVVKAAGLFDPLLYAVTMDNQLYYTAGDVWTAAAADGESEFVAFVGGPFGALGLLGSSSDGRDLGVYFRTTGGPGPTIPQTIPAVPDNQSLVGAYTDFLWYGYYGWDVNALNTSIALGVSDAWLLIDSSDSQNLLLRSRSGTRAFSEWEAYPTAPWTFGDEPYRLPYSITDASDFRSGYAGMQGKRGEFFAIGNLVHILHYYPEDDLNAESLELGTSVWSAVDDADAAALVVDSSTSTSGETSLRFDQAGYIEIVSEPFLAANLDASGGEVFLDVLAEPGSGWLGEVQLYIEIPDAGLYHQYAAQVDIAPVATGDWRTVAFTVPEYLEEAVRDEPTGVRVGIAVNSPRPGVWLDNLVFGGPIPEPVFSDFVCGGACLSAAPLGPNTYSGSFDTTQAKWFVVEDTVNGWQASELGGRTIRVNGEAVTPGGALPLPTPEGRYYFEFSAGSPTWTAWSYW